MCRVLVIPICFVAVAAILPCAAAAQTTTADGVQALVRGDYQTAARILRPLAEGTSNPDPVAQCFMATLYQSGRGVARSPMRACSLYRASSRAAHPFTHQADALARETLDLAPVAERFCPPANATPWFDIVRAGTAWFGDRQFGEQADVLRQRLFVSIGQGGIEQCTWLATYGMDSRFEPVTFTLEPAHWISWDERGATISYEGKHKRVEAPFVAREAVFLPLQHTELTTGSLRSIRRHFIEAFYWAPRVENQWMLQWHLFEVVRDTLVTVAADSLITATMADPRAAAPVDVRQFVRLRVNEEGRAEWTILQGEHARSEKIESEEEREDVRQREAARRKAEARIDWNRVQDVHRPPVLTYADGDGCGDVFLYGWSADRAEAITIQAEKNALQLSTTSQTFDLATTHAGLEVVVHVYERPVRHTPFCTDVVGLDGSAEETWRVQRRPKRRMDGLPRQLVQFAEPSLNRNNSD